MLTGAWGRDNASWRRMAGAGPRQRSSTSPATATEIPCAVLSLERRHTAPGDPLPARSLVNDAGHLVYRSTAPTSFDLHGSDSLREATPHGAVLVDAGSHGRCGELGTGPLEDRGRNFSPEAIPLVGRVDLDNPDPRVPV